MAKTFSASAHYRNDPNKVLAKAHPAQKKFILDPARRKAGFVIRRGGKTTAGCIYMIYEALKFKNKKFLYMALTKDQAENVTMQQIIVPILEECKIDYRYNKSKRIITFTSTGSTIQLTGADATEMQITRYLGSHYRTIIFDECQNIRNDLKYYIDDILGPSMIDDEGTIVCLGTAGNAIGRYWYEITRPDTILKSWSVHRWSGDDNPTIKDLLASELERMKAENPGIEEDPGFRNQYKCEWVLNSSDRIYHNTPSNILQDKFLITSLLAVNEEWKYIVGFDFGFTDASSFVVLAYRPYDYHIYVVETFKKEKMLLEEIALVLMTFRNRYKPVHFVGDCQNLTVVQTLRDQYKLPLRPADKAGKVAHISFMNSAFTTNKIQIIEGRNEPLLDEWAKLTWNIKKKTLGIFEELASRENHSADAALYSFHFTSRIHYAPPPIKEPVNHWQQMTDEQRQTKKILDRHLSALQADSDDVTGFYGGLE
jgi:Terminase large subunit, T4likevirus-type, N-terminal